MTGAAADVFVREATPEDLDGILAITKEEKLWGGLDYLVPSLLKVWLVESKRCNLVFLHENQEIFGFRSYVFSNGGTLAHSNAGRIHSSVRGKGVWKIVMELAKNYILDHFPSVTHFISAIVDHDMTDDQVLSPKHGKLLTKKSSMVIDDDFYTIDSKLTANAKDIIPENQFNFLTKEMFQHLLRSPSFSKEYLENDVLCLERYPYFLADEDALQALLNQKSCVLLEGSEEDDMKSLSILSPIFIENVGGHRSALNMFFPKSRAYEGSIGSSVSKHITLQIRKLMDTKSTLDRPHWLEIFAQERVIDVVLNLMQGKNMEKDIEYFVNNKRGRSYDTVYIYP